ncbi:MAG: flippase-like domain-containing protein [Alphaproteobacteria bacterium]|nr:flippase-like domain-containing protein [Alphaproteobacteria bacterium]
MSRQTLAFLVKLAISAALIAFLVNRVQFGPLIARFQNMSPGWAALALPIFLFQLAITGWRYGLIVRVVGLVLPIAEAIRLLLIGHFFSQTLPSAIGGDAVRAYMTTRLGLSWGRAVSAVLCDRGVGMLVLLFIATATIPIFIDRVADASLRLFALVPALAAFSGLAVLVAANNARIAWAARWRLARPFALLIGDLRRVVIASAESPVIVMISLLAQLSAITSVWLLGKALRLDIAFLDCLVLMPPIFVVTLVPVSIAGWGIREAAMVFAFGLVGVTEADALGLSVATGLCQIVAGIPGGLIWLARGRPAVGVPAPPAPRPTSGTGNP